MSIRYGYFDNQLIGVDELKDITRSIQSDGISIDEDNFTVSDLNPFHSIIFNKGIVPETDTSLKVSVDGNSIVVLPGTAYFDNGTFITVTDDANEILNKLSGVINYVYAVSSREEGKAYIGVYDEEKQSDENNGTYYVALAEISADGTVTDKRVYAKSALAATPPENASGNYFSDTIILADAGRPEGETKILRINVNPADYKYLQIVDEQEEDKRSFVQADISNYNALINVVHVSKDYRGYDQIHFEEKNTYPCYLGMICRLNNSDCWALSISSIDERGIELTFTAYTNSGNNPTYDHTSKPLKFKISLIRKETITDETTVTIEQ